MKKRTTNRNLVRHLLIALLTLIAFTPCKVKDPVLQHFNIDYQRPLNQNKTVPVFHTSCFSGITAQASNTEIIKQQWNNHPATIQTSFLRFFSNNRPTVHHFTHSTENVYTLPLYILYRQLKIAVSGIA